MFILKIEKECGCFKKSNLKSIQEFSSHKDVLKEANSMCKEMNETFCQKHIFSMEENGNELMIKVAMRD